MKFQAMEIEKFYSIQNGLLKMKEKNLEKMWSAYRNTKEAQQAPSTDGRMSGVQKEMNVDR